ncbi:alpha/beta hydrolase [Kribbella catacumbae]|uniref:alpha/beta hydrolase n=1 Tax=Kribbella catacumbae TaxID=460086 RepID=UPI00039F1453|nr:alpha/beta hydrolase [Kribbella catacumbae]
MSSREAVILPGGMFGPFAPLLMFSADAAERRGARLTPVWWDEPDRPMTLTPEERGPWVVGQLERAAPSLRSAEAAVEAKAEAGAGPAGEGTLIVAKSLGTHAAVVAAELALPAVWLTPVLTSEWVVDGLRRATAPFLLVGGTADSLWDSGLARELTPYVMEVEGADHGMYVPGRLAASTAVLGQVATAVEDFLDEAVWP